MIKDSNIFNSWVEMDCFCYDIVEAWIEYRKSKSMTCTEEDWFDWFHEYLAPALEWAYQDCVENEEEDE
ncbi:MAG: hypothetical protein ACI4XN_13770 [Candidatus Kurthia intestinigallinarum]